MFFSNLRKERRIINAIQHMNKAQLYFSEGKYDDAILENKMAIDKFSKKEREKDSLTPEAREFFADIHNNLGATYFRKALSLNKTDSEYKELFELALNEYKKILYYDPKNAEAYNNIGACEKNLGNPDASIEARNISLDINPNYPESYVNLGDSYLEQKEYDLAITAYSNAIDIRNDYAVAYYKRALAYSEMENIQDAIFDYQSVIKYDNKFHIAYINCGLLYYEQANYKKAIECFRDAIVYSANDDALAFSHNCIAIPLSKINEKKLSLVHFQLALTLSTNPEFNETVENNINKYLY